MADTSTKPMTPDERFELAASPEAAPKVTDACTVMDTPAAIERFRQICLFQALGLMAKGIRVTRMSPLKIARNDYGINERTAAKAYAKLGVILRQKGIIGE